MGFPHVSRVEDEDRVVKAAQKALESQEPHPQRPPKKPPIPRTPTGRGTTGAGENTATPRQGTTPQKARHNSPWSRRTEPSKGPVGQGPIGQGVDTRALKRSSKRRGPTPRAGYRPRKTRDPSPRTGGGTEKPYTLAPTVVSPGTKGRTRHRGRGSPRSIRPKQHQASDPARSPSRSAAACGPSNPDKAFAPPTKPWLPTEKRPNHDAPRKPAGWYKKRSPRNKA